MDKSQQILSEVSYSSHCPFCNKKRMYKTKQGYLRGLNKPCKSCSNSRQRGGSSWDNKCIDCGGIKDYPKSSSLCLSCHNKRTSIYHTTVYRFKKYDTTKDWYEIEAKKGCAICGVKLDPYSNKKRDRGHIDHCHETNKVRGVLCDLCNKGLGQFRDSILYLENAIKYLRKANKNNGS